MINTRCSWLHGDPRGFRSRDNQLHSSGDYKSPPPSDEHANLHKYHKEHTRPTVVLPDAERSCIGRKIVSFLRQERHRVIAVAVGRVHAHVLLNLPDDMRVVRDVFGEVKRWSSRAVSQTIPGSIWSAGGAFKPIADRSHLHNVYGYILYDQGRGAWTWSHADVNDDGMFGRKRPRK